MIDLDILSNFMVVAKTMNITKAASMLYISQSALSRQIQLLEKQLGAVLLTHNKKSLQLTVAGKILFDNGPELLSLADELTTQISVIGRKFESNIVIDTAYLYDRFLRNLYVSFRSQYPSINCTVFNRRAYLVQDEVISGSADLGLIDSAMAEEFPSKAKLLNSLPISIDPLAVMVNEEHPFAKKGYCTLDDLRAECNPLIYSSSAGGFTSGGRFKFFTNVSEKEKINITVSEGLNWETIMYDVDVQNNVIICLKSFEQSCAPHHVVLEVKDSGYFSTQMLVWSKSNSKSAVNKFINLAKAELTKA